MILDGKNGALKESIQKPASDTEWPENRGWSDGDVSDGAALFLFGGLSGGDKNPRRLDDLWKCEFLTD